MAMAAKRIIRMAYNGVLSQAPAPIEMKRGVTMTVLHYRKDPRKAAERKADESVRRLVERGGFLKIDKEAEREAIAHVHRRYESRRATVATLGKELGLLRRAHGLTQEAVALALGTNKSNISRLESGRYGGLTIEYFIAILDAFSALDQATSRGRGRNKRIATPQ
jgi:DNA-binding XRE family transcriptional regulator